jgi:hypothetical protein
MRRKKLRTRGKVTSRRRSISATFPKNFSGEVRRERIRKYQSSENNKGAVEYHIGVGWKTAFGLHLPEKIEARNKEEKKVMAIRGIYCHPDHRPGTNPLFQKFWLWMSPFIVWDKDGPKGFISQNRAMDFYYKCSRDMPVAGIASIQRKGWFVKPE